MKKSYFNVFHFIKENRIKKVFCPSIRRHVSLLRLTLNNLDLNILKAIVIAFCGLELFKNSLTQQ
jgi:hypothetical protein